MQRSFRIRHVALLLLLPLGLTLLPAVQVYRVRVGIEVPPLLATLGWAGFLSAVGALLVGGLVLWRVRADAARASTSPEALQAALEGGWVWISRLTFTHAALLFASLVSAGLYELTWTSRNFAEVGWIPLLFLLPLWVAIIACGRLLLASLRVLAPLPDAELEVLGRLLSRDMAPGVWAWVDELASRLGAPVPDQLVVGLDEGFFVTAAPVRLRPQNTRLEGRTLYLPLPLLQVLSRDEASSIVGHELGHFAMEDPERGVRIALANRRLHQGLERLAQQQELAPSVFNLPALWTLSDWGSRLELAWLGFSRVQEVRADAIGARVTSPQRVAGALLRLIAIAEHVEEALEAAKRSPGKNAVELLLSSLKSASLTLSESQLGERLAHPVDSHPPTRARLDALNVTPDAALLELATRRPSPDDTSWFPTLLNGTSAAA